MRFGQIIKTRRTTLHISQEALAKQSGLKQSRVGEIERGKENVKWKELTAIANALNLEYFQAWIELDKEMP